MPQVRGHRRKHSRSLSPLASKHKRSWQNSSGDRFGGDRGGGHPSPPRHHSLSPVRGNKKDFQPPPKFSGRRDYSSGSGAVRKSLSPHGQKRPRTRSPVTGGHRSASYHRQPKVPVLRSRDKLGSGSGYPSDERSWSHRNDEKSGSRSRQRSPSRRPQTNVREERGKRDAKSSQLSPSPGLGPSMKKKTRHSSASPCPTLKRPRSRSYDTAQVSSSQAKSDLPSSSRNSGTSVPQRRVSTAVKKKTSRITLHKRFTLDDQEPFELEENVTIAILRKADAQPSEDVTVKRVFDASQFKMIHKKSEGRRPIFDREEIKVWRHDENLSDDPDFERRLVRVKSTSVTSKSSSDNISRMSPDVIRKAIGLEVGGRSSRSSRMEPRIRLDPRPDPRYESRFRKQLEKEEELARRRKKSDDKRREDDRGSADNRGSRGDDVRQGNSDNKGSKGNFRNRRWENDTRGKEETYDLRQALERRRSDREEGSFKIEVRHGGSMETQVMYRDSQQASGSVLEHGGFVQESGGSGRNVVLGDDRYRRRFSGDQEREVGRRFGDGQGRAGFRGRGGWRDWSLDRGGMDGGTREDNTTNFRVSGRNFERRPRYNDSPTNMRGWAGGYRGRGRARVGDFATMNQSQTFPPEINDSFKYSQHDDRDVSPKPFRGRGGGGRFLRRNFGGNSFRAVNHGGFRGGARGQRGGYRGRGYGLQGGRRSLDKGRDVSVDREWKHDMYDSLQAEEEQPHSTTAGT